MAFNNIYGTQPPTRIFNANGGYPTEHFNYLFRIPLEPFPPGNHVQVFTGITPTGIYYNNPGDPGIPIVTETLQATVRRQGGFWGCSICNKIFKRKDRAREHVDTHNGQKRFACGGECGLGTCTAMFVSKDKLRCHAEHKTVMCPECSKIVSAKNLARHRKQMHPAPDDNM